MTDVRRRERGDGEKQRQRRKEDADCDAAAGVSVTFLADGRKLRGIGETTRDRPLDTRATDYQTRHANPYRQQRNGKRRP
jgi:hypothetical protein